MTQQSALAGGGGSLQDTHPWTHSPSPLTPICDVSGHTLLGDPVTFADGVMVDYCATCGRRVTVNWIMGGMAAVRLRLMSLMILDAEEPTEAMIEDFLETREKVLVDRERIDDVLAVAEIIKAKLGSELP